MNYTPDRWVVLRISHDSADPIYKVFASWRGGFTGSDYWQINSGISSVRLENDVYTFTGYSGSIYACHANAYGTITYSQGVLDHMVKNAAEQGVRIEVLDESYPFLELVGA